MENSQSSGFSFGDFNAHQPFSATQQNQTVHFSPGLGEGSVLQPHDFDFNVDYTFSRGRQAHPVQLPNAADQYQQWQPQQQPFDYSTAQPVQQQAALDQNAACQYGEWASQAIDHLGAYSGQTAQPPTAPSQFQQQVAQQQWHVFPGIPQAQQAEQPAPLYPTQQHQQPGMQAFQHYPALLAEDTAVDGCTHRHVNAGVVAARVALCSHVYNGKGQYDCKSVGEDATQKAVTRWLSGQKEWACKEYRRQAQKGTSQWKRRAPESPERKA